jgi:regulator of Ty1 transposition protein 103
MKQTVLLAFDDLPHHLKSCFLYLEVMKQESLPADAPLGGQGLHVWPHHGIMMEEVCQGYVMELISRCVVKLCHTLKF